MATRLLVILNLLLLSILPTMAGRGPTPSTGTNAVMTVAQNSVATNIFIITDDAVGWSGITSTRASFLTNNALVNSMLFVTNFAEPYGPPSGWTNAYSLETNRLVVTPGNTFGTNRIQLVSVDLWGDSTTNYITLYVTHVSQPPSFNFQTNVLVVPGDSGPQTYAHFIQGITNGAGNPPGAWTLVPTYAKATNGVTFTKAPMLTNYNGSSSLTADLAFAVTNRSYGSNLVTVVMTDSGASIGGGKIAATNQFLLVVTPVTHAPVIFGATNETILQNGPGLVRLITVTNDANAAVTLTASSLTPSVATASITATNAATSLSASFNLSLAPVHNMYGNATVLVVASYTSGANTVSTTNTLVLAVPHVSQPPSFTFSTNQIVVNEESPAQTVPGFLTALSPGAGNPPGLTWKFTVPTATNNSAANAHFTVWPSIATNGTLTFTPATHSFGTNTISVIMTDSGGITNGGYIAFTNSFQLAVLPTSHVPVISAVTNVTILENHGATNITVNVWDFDTLSNNLALRAVSLNPNLATVAITATNSFGTNTHFTVSISPTTNTFGWTNIALTASELSGNAAAATTNIQATVTHVTQAPHFAMATNALVATEQATAAAVTYPNFLTAMTNGAGNLPGSSWTFTAKPSNSSLFAVAPAIAPNGTLTYTTAKLTNGSSTVTVLMTDTDAGESTANGGVTTFSNTFTLTMSSVNVAAGFAVPNTLTVLENAGLVTSNNFLTQITPGLGNPSNTTWTFSVVCPTNAATNVGFAVFPSIATNGTLTFATAANGYGTNTVTVIMADAGAGLNAATSKYTNSFFLQVPWVNQPPSFALATNSVTVAAYNAPVVIPNAATNILEGPANQTNNQTVSFNLTNNNNALFTSQPAMDANGTFTFTPGSQGGTAIVQIQAMNSGGTANGGVNVSSNQTLTVIIPTNTPSFDLAVHSITVDDYNLPMTISNVAVHIAPGLPNTTTNQTIAFVLNNSSNALFAVQPAMDTNGTLTFTPASQGGVATVQVQITDSLGGASTNQTLTITVPQNTFQGAAGTYAGLFYGTNTVAQSSSGYVNVELATNGTFNGYVLCGTDSNTFAGQFDISNYSATVSAASYLFNLKVDTANFAVSGAVSNTASAWNSPLTGYLSGAGNSMDGSYLAVMPGFDNPKIASVGDSVFMFSVAGGAASLIGNMSDSNQVVEAGTVCTNGFLPIYIPMYTNSTGAQGLVIGWFNLANTAENSQTPGSTLLWIAQNSASPLYPKGFTNSTPPLISTFDASQPQLLPITRGYVQMSGGTLTVPIVEAISIVNNQVTVSSPTGNGLTLTINTNTGEVQGTFTDSTGATNEIESVILQNDEVAQGYFLGAGQSGSFLLVANAVPSSGPPYPAFTRAVAASGLTMTGYSEAGISSLVILENSDTNDLKLSLTLYDPLTNKFNVTATSADPSVVTVTTNGTGSSRDIWFAPVTNQFGSNILITVTADDGTLTNIFDINLTVAMVNHAPSFTLATNAYTVADFDLPVSVPNAVTNISAGPASENYQTVNFIVSNDSSNLFLAQPAIDGSGTLTYKPGNAGGTATVTVQAHDNGGTANGGADTSGTQTITINIPANPYDGLVSGPNNTGAFAGLFNDTNAASPVLDRSGCFSLLLTNDGTFGGYLVCAAVTNAFVGQFNLSSNATVTAGGYTLNLNLDPGAATVSGTVVSTSPSWTATLQSYLVAAPGIAGTYNATLPGFSDSTAGPAGYSTFMATIDAQGDVSLTGSMADATPVNAASVLSATGLCPIYLPLCTNHLDAGLLFGWISFTNPAGSRLTWFTTSGAGSAAYPAGFTNQAVPTVSAYLDAPQNNLTNISHYVVLSGGSVGATPLTNAITLLNESVTVDPSANDGLTLAFNDATGEVQGSFVANGVTNNIESLILQNTNEADGYFVSADGTQCGSFALLSNFTPPNSSYLVFAGLPATKEVLENSGATNLSFTIFDPLSTNFTSVACTSSASNVVTAGLTGSSTAWTLQLTPVSNANGTNIAINIVASDDKGQTNSYNLLVTVGWVNQPPSFNLNVTTLVVNQYNLPVTVSNAAINILAGPANQTNWETVAFNEANDNSTLFAVQPAIDASGTLTFTPGSQGGTATVSIQLQNSGGTANGGIDTSAAQTFTIVIPTNTFKNLTGPNLTANFAGLFYNTTSSVPASSGYFAMTLTNDGTFQVSVVNGGATNSTKGQFTIAESAANLTLGNYGLGLDIDTVGGTVTGLVTNQAANWCAELTSYLCSNSVIVPGTYTLMLPGFDDLSAGPVGYSFLTADITNNGSVTLTGYLADNTFVSQTTALSANGYCPVYIPLYPGGTNGLLTGWLTFTNDLSNSDNLTSDSTLTWFNAAGATPDLYPAGFTNQAVVVASTYETNGAYAGDLLGATSSSGYGYLVLGAGNLGADPVVKKVSITDNVISAIPPTDHSFSLTITPATGVVQGWFIAKGITNNINGAIFQNADEAGGYFSGVSTNECGWFMLYGE